MFTLHTHRGCVSFHNQWRGLHLSGFLWGFLHISHSRTLFKFDPSVGLPCIECELFSAACLFWRKNGRHDWTCKCFFFGSLVGQKCPSSSLDSWCCSVERGQGTENKVLWCWDEIFHQGVSFQQLSQWRSSYTVKEDVEVSTNIEADFVSMDFSQAS